jgi:Mg/Co/Ni transporter MgtE
VHADPELEADVFSELDEDLATRPTMASVGDALARVRESPLLQPEALTSVHAVDDDDSCLRGVARLVTLVQADPAASVIEVSDTDPVRVGADADITGVAVLMTDYNLITIPVVDDVRRLLGVITVDDVLEATLPEDWRRREAAEPPGTRHGDAP